MVPLCIFPFDMKKKMPLYMMMATLVLSLSAVQGVVIEKETRIKDYMLTMGASNLMQWLAWYLYYLIFICMLGGIFTYYLLDVKTGKIIYDYFELMHSHRLMQAGTYDVMDQYTRELISAGGVFKFSTHVYVYVSFVLSHMQIICFYRAFSV